MPVTHDPKAGRLGYLHHPDRYDKVLGRLLRRLYARVTADVAAAGLPAGGRLLDVGTGPGRVPLAIADALPHLRVDALDLSPQMIEKARHRAAATGRPDRVRFVVGDVARLPYPDQTFDLVISSMSQHHWTDPQAALEELRRVVRPTGQVWIYDIRVLLPRADPAARRAFPGHAVRREALRNSWLPVRLTARLTVAPR